MMRQRGRSWPGAGGAGRVGGRWPARTWRAFESEPELTKNAVGIPVRPRNAGLFSEVALHRRAHAGFGRAYTTFRTSLSLAIDLVWEGVLCRMDGYKQLAFG